VRDNLPAARAQYEQAIQIARQVGYRWAEAIVQWELSDLVRMQGEYSLALALIEPVLTLLRELNEQLRTAYASEVAVPPLTPILDQTKLQTDPQIPQITQIKN